MAIAVYTTDLAIIKLVDETVRLFSKAIGYNTGNTSSIPSIYTQ